MGTNCLIGLQVDDEVTKWITIQLDGYYENIIPILREYTQRTDVEKLIKLGSQSSLCPLNDLPEIVNEFDTDCPAEVADSRNDLPEYQYNYIFTTDNKWICSTDQFIDMDHLNY